MTRSIHHMARQLEREHGIKTYANARRLVQAYADKISDRPDLWDGQNFTERGAQYLNEDINDVLQKMASACQTTTITQTSTKR